MTPEKLYDLSTQASIVAKLLKVSNADLYEFHLLRYRYFVDGSAARHDCHYSRATYQAHHEEQEMSKLIAYLQNLNTNITNLLDTLCQTT